MKIAITAIAISTFILGTIFVAMSGVADDIANYISKNGE
jgi:predicted MFS family arabinose efflux permease